MGAVEVVEFLSYLAVDRQVTSSTQNQALAALLFLYRSVLGRELEGLDTAVRARAPRRLPVVMTREEVRTVLSHLSGEHALIAGLLYGSGLRLLECLRLRIKDLDRDRRQLIVREGKGNRDRATLLPASLEAAITRHLGDVRSRYERDRRKAVPGVALPHALERKGPKRAKSGAGSGSSRPRSSHVTPARESSVGIISRKRAHKEPSAGPSSALESRSASPRTPFATPSRRTCSKTVRTSGRCRFYSGTEMCGRR